MKFHNLYTALLSIGILFTTSCSDFLDTKSPSYDSSGIYQTEAGI